MTTVQSSIFSGSVLIIAIWTETDHLLKRCLLIFVWIFFICWKFLDWDLICNKILSFKSYFVCFWTIMSLRQFTRGFHTICLGKISEVSNCNILMSFNIINGLNLLFGLDFNKHHGWVHFNFWKVEITSSDATTSFILSFRNPLVDKDIIIILKSNLILSLKLLEKLFSL